MHRSAFCQFLFCCIYYYGSNKSTGKETGKMHLCGMFYFMLMLPSKVMPYLHRLAAPLTETSIVHWNDFSFFLNLCTYYYFFIQVLFQCNFSFAQNYCSILLLHLTSNWCFGLEYTICICRYVQ